MGIFAINFSPYMKLSMKDFELSATLSLNFPVMHAPFSFTRMRARASLYCCLAYSDFRMLLVAGTARRESKCILGTPVNHFTSDI